MTTTPQVYGDITPRTAAYAVAPLLKRHDALMILEKFGQTFPLPTKSTIVAKFRRFEALPLATTALVEGGTQVGYSNGGLTTVNTPINLTVQRTATATLLRQRGHYINEVVSSSAGFRTEPVEAGFVAIFHPDVTNDIRNMQVFIPAKQYAGQTKLFPGEICAVEDVRYCRSVLFTPFLGETGVYGGASTTMRNTGGFADVYSVIYISKDAYGIVPLKGSNALSLIAHNPGSSGTADPLNQRGTLGWKVAQTSIILNELWVYRAMVAVTL